MRVCEYFYQKPHRRSMNPTTVTTLNNHTVVLDIDVIAVILDTDMFVRLFSLYNKLQTILPDVTLDLESI
jgi:hypothetical protein